MVPSHVSTPSCIKIFIAHAPKDSEHAIELEKHLKPYHNQRLIDIWHHGLLGAGDDCRAETHKFEEANIVLMLISPDFMASADCSKVQQRAMERFEAGDLKVIPIKLRSKVPDGVAIRHLASLPRNSNPILSRRDKDRAWTEVAEGIQKVVYELRAGCFEQPPMSQDLAARRAAGAEFGFIKEGERFTLNLGHGTGFLYRPGPLVLTYIEPKTTLVVSSGPPWMHQDDAPIVASLRGDSFRGEFFVQHGWSIYGFTKRCVCSGFYPYNGLPLPDGEYQLADKALFLHHYGKRWNIIVPNGVNLDRRKENAIREAEQLVKVRLKVLSEWWETQTNGGGVMNEVDPQY